MKTRWVLLMVVCMVTVLHAVKAAQKAGLAVRVTPAENALMIWVIQERDSVRVSPAVGSFVIEAMPDDESTDRYEAAIY